MGYYANITGADFLIPTKNLDKAYKAMCDLNKHDHLKRGGSWSGGQQTAVWFAWMPEDYPAQTSTAAEILELLGFYTETSDEGVRIVGYDSKVGDEDYFLNAIAHLVKPGSWIEWQGEDGAMWRQEFPARNMVTKYGRVVFD